MTTSWKDGHRVSRWLCVYCGVNGAIAVDKLILMVQEYGVDSVRSDLSYLVRQGVVQEQGQVSFDDFGEPIADAGGVDSSYGAPETPELGPGADSVPEETDSAIDRIRGVVCHPIGQAALRTLGRGAFGPLVAAAASAALRWCTGGATDEIVASACDGLSGYTNPPDAADTSATAEAMIGVLRGLPRVIRGTESTQRTAVERQLSQSTTSQVISRASNEGYLPTASLPFTSDNNTNLATTALMRAVGLLDSGAYQSMTSDTVNASTDPPDFPANQAALISQAILS